MDAYLFHGDLVETKRILYTPSDFAKESLLHLQEIGELKAQKLHKSSRQNLRSYLFFMVLEGSGTLTYEGIEHTLYPGDCVYIDCTKNYVQGTSPDLWRLKWVHFYGPCADLIYQKYLSRGGLPAFHPESLTSFFSLWEKLYQVAEGQDYLKDMRINEYLTGLQTLLMEESWHPESQGIGEKRVGITEIKKYIDEHFNEKISLDDLASKFYINKYYLTRIFGEQYGVPVGRYIMQLRITKAKNLLRFSDKSIEDIGYECGIGAPYYFSRSFKKIEGISPSEYRKRW